MKIAFSPLVWLGLIVVGTLIGFHLLVWAGVALAVIYVLTVYLTNKAMSTAVFRMAKEIHKQRGR